MNIILSNSRPEMMGEVLTDVASIVVSLFSTASNIANNTSQWDMLQSKQAHDLEMFKLSSAGVGGMSWPTLAAIAASGGVVLYLVMRKKK